MGYKIRPDVDVIKDVLQAVLAVQPESDFVKSLWVQYQERGGLSKKQLEGLLGKASRIKDMPVAKLATLEAIILRKHTRQKSPLPENAPLFTRDEQAGKLITAILSKYPAHKRVLLFQARYESNQPLSAAELAELNKFYKLLVKP